MLRQNENNTYLFKNTICAEKSNVIRKIILTMHERQIWLKYFKIDKWNST